MSLRLAMQAEERVRQAAGARARAASVPAEGAGGVGGLASRLKFGRQGTASSGGKLLLGGPAAPDGTDGGSGGGGGGDGGGGGGGGERPCARYHLPAAKTLPAGAALADVVHFIRTAGWSKWPSWRGHS